MRKYHAETRGLTRIGVIYYWNNSYYIMLDQSTKQCGIQSQFSIRARFKDCLQYYVYYHLPRFLNVGW